MLVQTCGRTTPAGDRYRRSRDGGARINVKVHEAGCLSRLRERLATAAQGNQ